MDFLTIVNNSFIWIHAGSWGILLASLLLLMFANPDMLKLFPSGMQNLENPNPWFVWFEAT